MKDKNKSKRGGVSPVAAAVTGAIVGGVAVAGALANRKKIEKTLSDLKDKATGYAEDVKNAAHEKEEEVVENLKERKDRAIDKAERIKDVIADEL